MDETEDDLRKRVMYLRWELEDESLAHAERVARLGTLAEALQHLFQRSADVTALREAIRARRAAVVLAAPGRPRRHRDNHDLGRLLLRLFTATTDLDPRRLDRALAWSYPAAAQPEQGDAGAGVAVGCLVELASALRREYQRTDELATLSDAVDTARLVVALAPPGHPARGRYEQDLARLLWLLSGRNGDPTVLDEALRLVRGLPPEHSSAGDDRGARPALLARILTRRVELTGALDALREATEVGRDAVTAARPGRDRARYQADLADQLRLLSERTGELAAAREAVLLAREAVGALRPDDAGYAEAQAALGSSTAHLAVRTDDGQLVADAIRECRRAVAVTPVRHPDHLPRLEVLHRALMVRYGRSKDPSALEHALACARDLVGSAPADHPDRGRYLSHLSGALRERFLAGDRTDLRDLKDSTEYARQAAAGVPPNHPGRATSLASLSELLHLSYERTHDRVSLREFVTTNAAIARMHGAPVSQRIAAAQRAAQADLVLGRARHAMTMTGLATALLPQLGLRDVDRADRERRIGAAHRLPATAAAVAIALGEPGTAVELLEQTRGVVFAGTLDTREDVTDLRRAAPDLLPRFRRIRDEVNAADHATTPYSGEHRDAAGRDPRELAAHRAALSRQWDELLEQIRQRPGLAGFQRPTPIAELRRQADAGPIVYVVADESRAHALIVRDDPGTPVTVVDLPDLTRSAVLRQAEAFHTALGVALDRDQPARARRDAQPRMLAVLAWMWDHITGPVLERLDRTGPPRDGESWPRVWWCPVGVVTLLPLHAAGRHGSTDDTDTVLGRVVSSYTPTIRALAHARRAASAARSTLIVAVPDAPQTPPLDGAAGEAELVRALVPDATVLPPAGARTSRAGVLDGLRQHGIVHLACHGYANLGDPSGSRLLLHDHETDPLTLHTITRLNLRHAQLAYLSACSTTGTNRQQADEATHLTAAFQLAGYRNVIGTLWPINDRAARTVAGAFYAELTGGGATPPDPGRAALALHRAVGTVRRAAPALPSRWAAYIHSGA
jgi:hypothetical protein